MEVPVPVLENPQAVIVAPLHIVAANENTEVMELQKSLNALEGKFSSLKENQRKLADQNSAILAELECPVCFSNFANKRVIMCENGHNVCEGCNGGLQQCPLGRCTLGVGKNLFVAMAAAVTLVPCKYGEEGCYALYPLLAVAERELHEVSCPHRFQCKIFLADNENDELAYCQWRGKRGEFHAHCMEHHPIINASEAVLSLPIRVASTRTCLEITFPFRCYNEQLFLLAFHYHRDANTRVLVPVSMFMGKREDLEKFKVSVTFISRDKKNEVVFAGFPCDPVREDFATIVTKHPYLDERMLKVFTNTSSLECAVRITLLE